MGSQRLGLYVGQETVPTSGVWLQLLGGFDLSVDGQSVPVGLSCQRLLRLLAVCGQQSRSQAAGTLWPEVATSRANANLRSTMWRFQRSYPRVLCTSPAAVCLTADVVVDLRQWTKTAQQLVNLAEPMDHQDLVSAITWCMKTDLIPDIGEDDWYRPERERYRQLGLHALEALTCRLVRAGWIGAAVDVALVAVRMDPLRESAHRALVQAYLAEENVSDARCQYERFRVLLREELGLAPSRLFEELLDTVGRSRSSNPTASVP